METWQDWALLTTVLTLNCILWIAINNNNRRK